MKKFIAPVVLLVLSAALVAYMGGVFGNAGNSFDSEAYLAARAEVDSLEIALWNAQGNSGTQAALREELASAWNNLAAMRSGSKVESGGGGVQEGLASDTLVWIVGGAFAVVLCVVILVMILRRRKIVLTRQMESVKADVSSGDSPEPEMVFIPPKPRPRKASIIADAEAYAARKRETMAQPKEALKPVNAARAPQKVVFEDENGVPENKILTEAPGAKPALRPTARERITSAMKNLSDVLRTPRGLSREHTMKLRAQSRNVTGDPNIGGTTPLETSRFDREAMEKLKVLQLSRRGFPASAIASTLKITQERVEAIIREAVG
ncbi:MAG: hypothetical protein HUK20_11630 [Fibrobacter sp.]|nr:hypothetical protein [Fibrobacter sp.]